MIPDINSVRANTLNNEKLNECKRITETQNKIDELAIYTPIFLLGCFGLYLATVSIKEK